jgi:hypothetical protein
MGILLGKGSPLWRLHRHLAAGPGIGVGVVQLELVHVVAAYIHQRRDGVTAVRMKEDANVIPVEDGVGGALQQIKHRVAAASPVDVVVVVVLEREVARFAPHVDAEKEEGVHRAEDDRGHERIQIVGGHVQNGGLRWALQQKGYLDEHPVAGEGCGGGAVPVDANDALDVE